MPDRRRDLRRGAPRRLRRSSAALRSILHDEGHATGQGDEGGFAPSLPSNEAAVEVILRAIEKAGYRPGDEVAIALDPATSSMLVERDRRRRRTDALPPRARGPDARLGRDDRPLGALGRRRYPIVSLEDGLAEDDWAGWRELTARLGRKIQLVGDDILVTNTDRSSPAASRKTP